MLTKEDGRKIATKRERERERGTENKRKLSHFLRREWAELQYLIVSQDLDMFGVNYFLIQV